MRRSLPAFAVLSCGLLLAGSLIAQAPRYSTFGSGCPGTAGVPVLEAAPEILPAIDDSFIIQFSNLPTGSASPGLFGLLGFSTTN